MGQGDPSLRLKNGYAQDDPPEKSRERCKKTHSPEGEWV